MMLLLRPLRYGKIAAPRSVPAGPGRLPPPQCWEGQSWLPSVDGALKEISWSCSRGLEDQSVGSSGGSCLTLSDELH